MIFSNRYRRTNLTARRGMSGLPLTASDPTLLFNSNLLLGKLQSCLARNPSGEVSKQVLTLIMFRWQRRRGKPEYETSGFMSMEQIFSSPSAETRRRPLCTYVCVYIYRRDSYTTCALVLYNTSKRVRCLRQRESGVN